MKFNFKISLLILIAGIFITSPALAKKKLIRTRLNSHPVHPYGAWTKPKLRKDKQAILLLLGGMDFARSVDYQLTYNTAGITQSVQGSHDPRLGSTQKELLFGTCSGPDCRYDQNIQDMFLTITIKLKNNKTLTQRYQINP